MTPTPTDAVDAGRAPNGPESPDPAEVRIASGSALTLATRVVGLAASFIVGILAARIFGVAGKGALSVVIQVPSLLVVIFDLGLTTSLIYFVSRGELKAGTAAANAFVISALLGVIGAPIIWALLSGPLALIPGVPGPVTAIAIGMLPLGLFTVWMLSVSTGLGDLKLPFWSTVASSATSVVGLTILLLRGHGSLTTVLAMTIAGTVFGIAVLVIGLRRRLVPLSPDLAAMPRIARFSLKAYLSSLAAVLQERQVVLLLGWLAGSAAVGLYSVGFVFAQLIWFVPTALSAAILAKGGRRSDTSAIDYTTRTSRVAVLFMLATVTVSLLAVPWLIPLLYGSAFASAVYPFLALLPGMLADGVSRILWSYQITRGRIYWKMAVGATVLNVAAIVVVAPAFGATGAGLACTVSYLVLSVLVIGRFCADTGTTVREVLVPTGADVAVVKRTVVRLIADLRQPR